MKGRSPLKLIALLLIASALVRVAGGAGEAIALATPEVAAPGGETVANSKECEVPEDMHALLDAFQARDARLTAQEDAMRVRRDALELAEAEIARQMAALAAADEALRSTIAVADGAAEGDVTQLTAVYENMKPKDAAALFEEMDPDFAAGFLGRMRPEAAAGIMAGLSPDAAYTISVVLAGRNARAPKN